MGVGIFFLDQDDIVGAYHQGWTASTKVVSSAVAIDCNPWVFIHLQASKSVMIVVASFVFNNSLLVTLAWPGCDNSLIVFFSPNLPYFQVFPKLFHLCLVSTDNPLCLLYSTSAGSIWSDRTCTNLAKMDWKGTNTENAQKTHKHQQHAEERQLAQMKSGMRHVSNKCFITSNTSGSWECVLLACKKDE